VPTVARGRQVCSCFDISQSEISAVLARTHGASDTVLRALQGELKCGTNCGSCMPEVRRLVRMAVHGETATSQPTGALH
jgi:assimilatory nitrate reductase catalytic subunit